MGIMILDGNAHGPHLLFCTKRSQEGSQRGPQVKA